MNNVHIHKTKMLYDSKGNMVGRKCECGAVFTRSGKASKPYKADRKGKHTPNKSHGKRVGFDD